MNLNNEIKRYGQIPLSILPKKLTYFLNISFMIYVTTLFGLYLNNTVYAATIAQIFSKLHAASSACRECNPRPHTII